MRCPRALPVWTVNCSIDEDDNLGTCKSHASINKKTKQLCSPRSNMKQIIFYRISLKVLISAFSKWAIITP